MMTRKRWFLRFRPWKPPWPSVTLRVRHLSIPSNAVYRFLLTLRYSRCRTRPVSRAVSYTHLDVYKRQGYVLAVNKANPVQELSAAQIKDVFDEEITNWKELGGPDAEVKVFRLEDITSYFSEEELGAEYEKAPRCIGEIVAGNPGIIAFVPSKFIIGVRSYQYACTTA